MYQYVEMKRTVNFPIRRFKERMLLEISEYSEIEILGELKDCLLPIIEEAISEANLEIFTCKENDNEEELILINVMGITAFPETLSNENEKLLQLVLYCVARNKGIVEETYREGI